MRCINCNNNNDETRDNTQIKEATLTHTTIEPMKAEMGAKNGGKRYEAMGERINQFGFVRAGLSIDFSSTFNQD